MRPARSAEDLPLPEAPTTATNGLPTRRAISSGDHALATEEVRRVLGLEGRKALYGQIAAERSLIGASSLSAVVSRARRVASSRSAISRMTSSSAERSPRRSMAARSADVPRRWAAPARASWLAIRCTAAGTPLLSSSILSSGRSSTACSA